MDARLHQGVPGEMNALNGHSKVKILAISYNFPPDTSGGYGLQMSWFCEGLHARGHKVEVLTVPPTSHVTPSDSPSMPVHRTLRFVRTTSPAIIFADNVRNVRAVRAAVHRAKPDVIFCGGTDFIGFNAYLQAIRLGPSFTWLGDTWLGQAWRDLPRYDAWHGLVWGGQRSTARRVRGRIAATIGAGFGLSSGRRPRELAPVAAISQFVLGDLRSSGAPVPAEAKVIPAALHPNFFDATGKPVGHSGNRPRALRALFVGRMEPLKGPHIAIRAVAQAVRQSADVQLTMAGLGIKQLQPELTTLARECGIADRVAFAGTPQLAQLIELYRTHDVFLFPSLIVEGLGVVNCEALACGLPIIGTADSGSAEVIIPNETGFRVQRNDPEHMGAFLMRLFEDRPLLESLSNHALKTAQKFSPATVIASLEQQIVRVHAQNPRVRGH